MRISLYRKFSQYLLVPCLALLVWGCQPEEDKHVDIDYYVVNTRPDEILVKERDTSNGIVGFFLDSGETYHFAYYGNMSFRVMDDDPHGVHIIFDFYASGDDASFTEYIGYCEFAGELDENYACVETCFVR
ncbi:MAG: hypothetical protein JSV10_03735 [Candidatus Zixiibacteriota bacterium]|nr:MAG: hypothetical protein JSV10_03735 [candidate division Zixibacteria bacterium]